MEPGDAISWYQDEKCLTWCVHASPRAYHARLPDGDIGMHESYLALSSMLARRGRHCGACADGMRLRAAQSGVVPLCDRCNDDHKHLAQLKRYVVPGRTRRRAQTGAQQVI